MTVKNSGHRLSATSRVLELGSMLAGPFVGRCWRTSAPR